MLRCEQVPCAGDGWSTCPADNNVAVHVPNGGLTPAQSTARIIKQNIGSAVTVEIGRSRQEPAIRKRWALCRPHMNIVVHIPDGGCEENLSHYRPREQIIRVSISVKIRYPHQVRGVRTKSWA